MYVPVADARLPGSARQRLGLGRADGGLAPLLFDNSASFSWSDDPIGVRRRLTACRSLAPLRSDFTLLRRTLSPGIFRNG